MAHSTPAGARPLTRLAWIAGLVTIFAAACELPAPSETGVVVAINVLIEPDDAMLATALAANARLRASYPAGFALDAGHVPHLTILQRFVRASDLDKVLAAASTVARGVRPGGLTLMATGLYASPFAGLQMVSVRVAPSQELVGLQQALVTALAPFVVSTGAADAFEPESDGTQANAATVAYVRDFVPRSSGVNYSPHVTVGVGDEAAVARLLREPFTPYRFEARSIAVYQLGNFGTARRLLRRSASRARRQPPD